MRVKSEYPTRHADQHLAGGSDPLPGWSNAPTGGSYESIILAEPTLFAYWPLNEPSGDALDASGNSHDLLEADFNGPPTQGSAGPFPADPDQTSYTFGGYLKSTDVTLDLDSASGVTVECWVYPTAAPGTTGFVAQCISSDRLHNSFALQFRSGQNILWGAGDTIQVDSVATVALNTWTYIVGTAAAAETLVYLDAAEVASGAASAPQNVTAPLFRIGSGQNVGGTFFPFTGRICQVALYSAALTPAEIAAHYAGRDTSGDTAGQVQVADGDGGTHWDWPLEVTY